MDINNILWLGASGGLAKYDGDEWMWYDTRSSGLPDICIRDIEVDPQKNTKWLGTMGGLVSYKDNTSGIKVENHNNYVNSIRIDNFPNPFSGLSRVEYFLDNDCKVSLGLYDCMGREIKKLVEERQTAGQHNFYINSYSLPGGVYYLRLETNGKVASKKINIIR